MGIKKRGLDPKYYTKNKNKNKNTKTPSEKSTTPSIFQHHQQSSIKHPTMIFGFKRSDSTTIQHLVYRRRHQNSLKGLESKKLAPNLESKVISPPESRHKSLRHPSTHEPPEQTP